MLLATIEVMVLFSSVYVAAFALFGSLEGCDEALGPLFPKAILVTSVAFVSLTAMGLYQFQQRLYFTEILARLAVGIALAFLALAIVFYAYPPLMISRNLAIVAAGYSTLVLTGTRYIFLKTVDHHVFRRRILVYGAGERAASIMALRRKADRRGFKLVAHVAAVGDNVSVDTEVLETNGKPVGDLAVEYGAEEIVVAMDDRRGNLPVRDLLDARLKGIDVVDLVQFLERETGKIHVELVNPSWLIFSPGFRRSRLRQFAKRLVDLGVSGSLFLVAWPIMLLVVLAIKIEDGFSAPIIYRQQRVGQGGECFDVLKFRSMSVNAEADGVARWASKDDNRITRVGGLLRKSRLDELPQVLNVLAGQMSIVGPRPERPEFVSELVEKIPYYAERHVVKPGITGWAQLKYAYGASEEDALEKLKYDLYYIKNQALIFDIMIVLQTVEVVLWGKGAR